MSPGATASAPAVHPRRTPVRDPPSRVRRPPRRVSGPARKGSARPARSRARRERGRAVALLAGLASLTQKRTLGGRPWIALVAFALIGIVTLQLGLLKLNGSIGRALEHEAVLQRENAALGIENSELAASDRVTSWAARAGMQTAPTAALRFLRVRPSLDPARAAGALATSIHPSATGSAESLVSSSTALASPSVTAQQSAAQAAPPASGEASTSGAAPSAPSPGAGAGTTTTSGEAAGRVAPQTAGPVGESAHVPASETPAPTAPAAGGSSEATPAGGTQAGPSG